MSAYTCAEPYGGLCSDCAQLGACTQTFSMPSASFSGAFTLTDAGKDLMAQLEREAMAECERMAKAKREAMERENNQAAAKAEKQALFEAYKKMRATPPNSKPFKVCGCNPEHCAGTEDLSPDYRCRETMRGAHDPVNHPSHYTSGNIECIDAIASALGDAFPAYCRGQAIKYLWRAGLKGDALEDARKAAWYCAKLVATLEGE